MWRNSRDTYYVIDLSLLLANNANDETPRGSPSMQAGNRTVRSFFFHSVDTATGVDGHLRSHRSLLMEWRNNSWIARPILGTASCSLPRRSVTRPHFCYRFFLFFFFFSFVLFPDTSDAALWLRPFRLVSVDCHWCPMATTTTARQSMNIHLPFVKKAFAVAKGFEAWKGRGEKSAERGREGGSMEKPWRGGWKRGNERYIGRREIDNGYAMVFRFFTMFAPNARSRR